MKDEERLEIYLDTLYPRDNGILREIGEAAVSLGVPVIRRSTERVLGTLLAMTRPERILEVGTAVGYSAIFMALHSDAHITTIENYEKRFSLARENFRLAGVKERITFLTGDAEELLPTLREEYDLIFLDAAQGQYVRFLPELDRLLKRGGTLVTDNVMIGGDLLVSRYAVERRRRTIHRRMREYLRTIIEKEGYVTSILPVGDGLAVTVKER